MAHTLWFISCFHGINLLVRFLFTSTHLLVHFPFPWYQPVGSLPVHISLTCWFISCSMSLALTRLSSEVSYTKSGRPSGMVEILLCGASVTLIEVTVLLFPLLSVVSFSGSSPPPREVRVSPAVKIYNHISCTTLYTDLLSRTTSSEYLRYCNTRS